MFGNKLFFARVFGETPRALARLGKKTGVLAVMLLAQLALQGANSAEYYVNPGPEPGLGDGTKNSPWSSVSRAFEANVLRPGDTLLLGTGYYGKLDLVASHYVGPVTISGTAGQTAKFSQISIKDSSNIVIKNLDISLGNGDANSQGPVVVLDETATDIILENSKISSAPDTSDWSADDWQANAVDGIVARGEKITLRSNIIRNVHDGISIDAANSLVEENVVENFSGNGIKSFGAHTVIQNNVVRNCVDVGNGSRAGFMSWSRGSEGEVGKGQVVGGVLRGNQILNVEDGDHPLRCSLQGIAMFDGIYKDWLIENNIIVVDNWNGIVVMGADNVRIWHNTVLDPDRKSPGPASIQIQPHKDGTPPKASMILNNLADNYNDPQNGVTTAGNMTVTSLDQLFVEPARGDFRLRSGSLAINAGVTRGYLALLGIGFPALPASDIADVTRPNGTWYDVGAYEFRPEQ